MTSHPFVVTLPALLFLSSSLGIFLFAKLRQKHGSGDGTVHRRTLGVVHGALVFAVAFCTHVVGYDQPAATLWDEGYHIVSAEKYLQGVWFQENHPPLGKLLIALGERAMGENRQLDLSAFLRTNLVTDVPTGYSFAGVRLANTLAATVAAVVLYLILLALLPSSHYAYLLSSLYLFDNGLIAHTRTAMLDGTQLLFVLLAILAFVRLCQRRPPLPSPVYLGLGLLCGLAIAVKLNAAIIVLLLPFLLFHELTTRSRAGGQDPADDHRTSLRAVLSSRPWRQTALECTVKSVFFTAAAVVVYLGSYYVHFALGRTVVDGRYYRASVTTRGAIAMGETGSPRFFFDQLRDAFAFSANYNKGIPAWDPCVTEKDGSPAYAWPFGGRTVIYRTERDGDRMRYIGLQTNPVVWYAALVAVIVAVLLVGGSWVWGLAPPADWRSFALLKVFLALYLAYMGIMLSMRREMYVYHYFIPLIFAFVIVALGFRHFFNELMADNNIVLYGAALVLAAEVVLVFAYFSPLTYYEPLHYEEVLMRAWSPAWKLAPVP